MEEKMNKKTAGRPKKLTEEVVGKLIYAFQKDFNVSEACDYAGISRDTYYEWCKNKKGFSDKMEQAKSDLKRKAKINLADKIEAGDIDTTLWYLERRAKDEYSTKQNIAVSGLEKEKSKLDDMLAQLYGGE